MQAPKAAVPQHAALEPWLVEQRQQLTGYCYRLLGSGFEAEDAVQETMVRAWQRFEQYDPERASLRTWVYAIATNVCFDMLRAGQRRARPMDLGPPSEPGPDVGAPLPEQVWIAPVPDSRVIPAGGDPAELAVMRETIRLAFVAALQHLPPKQRAVLVLRDVLRWRASEVAELLDTSTASVTSALQRARATIAAVRPAATDPAQPLDDGQRDLLAKYADAFERYDVERLVSLLHEDATMSMPPFPWWLRGRADIGRALLASDGWCRGSRLVPVQANGSPGFGQYVPVERGGFEPWALVILELSAGKIIGATSYLEAARLFPLFELPLALD